MNRLKLLSAFNRIGLCLSLLLSACAATPQLSSKQKDQPSKAPASTSQSKSNHTKSVHTHAANPCSPKLTHSHTKGSQGLSHSNGCENLSTLEKMKTNAHIHPATKTSKRIRHVHPNGTNKHSHNRQ